MQNKWVRREVSTAPSSKMGERPRNPLLEQPFQVMTVEDTMPQHDQQEPGDEGAIEPLSAP